MKDTICTVIGLIGGAIAALFGGWDTALQTFVKFLGYHHGLYNGETKLACCFLL